MGATPKSKAAAPKAALDRRESNRSRSPLKRRKPQSANPLGHMRPRSPSKSPPRNKKVDAEVQAPKKPRSEHKQSKPEPSFPEPPMPQWHEFKYGATNVLADKWEDQPRALLLFSGRPRNGDLASFLAADGWIIVVVDTVGPVGTNLLDEKVRKTTKNDIKNRVYDAIGVATPCETVSPLRENPLGSQTIEVLGSSGRIANREAHCSGKEAAGRGKRSVPVLSRSFGRTESTRSSLVDGKPYP